MHLNPATYMDPADEPDTFILVGPDDEVLTRDGARAEFRRKAQAVAVAEELAAQRGETLRVLRYGYGGPETVATVVYEACGWCYNRLGAYVDIDGDRVCIRCANEVTP